MVTELGKIWTCSKWALMTHLLVLLHSMTNDNNAFFFEHLRISRLSFFSSSFFGRYSGEDSL